MPEEILDTRNEKVSDVPLNDKNDGLIQQLVAKLSKNKFFGPLIRAIEKIKSKLADKKKKSSDKDTETKKESKSTKDKKTKSSKKK